MQNPDAQNQKIKTANFLAKALGVFWIIDGLLQLQPKMFGADFINSVLAPNLSNQPAFLHSLVTFGIHIFSLNIFAANLLAAALQIIIGILLVFPPGGKKFRLGLYLSIAWGLTVWIFGEGLGSLLTGSASLYTGAPGAAFLYALIAAFLLLPEKINPRFLAKAAALVLLLGAGLQLQPVFWGSSGTQMVVQLSASDAAHIISGLPVFLSMPLAAHPMASNWLLFAVPLLLGAALLLKPSRATAGITVIFLLLVWWLGQDFGELSTLWLGTATDINTAPLVMLLVLPIFLAERKIKIQLNRNL